MSHARQMIQFKVCLSITLHIQCHPVECIPYLHSFSIQAPNNHPSIYSKPFRLINFLFCDCALTQLLLQVCTWIASPINAASHLICHKATDKFNVKTACCHGSTYNAVQLLNIAASTSWLPWLPTHQLPWECRLLSNNVYRHGNTWHRITLTNAVMYNQYNVLVAWQHICILPQCWLSISGSNRNKQLAHCNFIETDRLSGKK